MEAEIVEYLTKMEEMFSTQGFKDLVRDAEEAIEARKERLLRVETLDEMRFIQGEVAQLQILVNMETIVNMRVQNAQEIEALETIDTP